MSINNLDKIICRALSKKSMGLLGPLTGLTSVQETQEIPTCATDGTTIFINPTYWDTLNLNQQIGVFLHELWHIARLHKPRCRNRDPELWNIVCDMFINIALLKEGFILPEGLYSIPPEHASVKTEEELYNILKNDPVDIKLVIPDLVQGPSAEANAERNQIQKVSLATTLAKNNGFSSENTLNKDLYEIIQKALYPPLPWKVLLRKYLTEFLETDFSWSKPNRRYSDVYLPSAVEVDGRLQSINYYFDVSYSISEDEIAQFNKELLAIRRELCPHELRVKYFNTKIIREDIIRENDPIRNLRIPKGGGTSLLAVLKDIKEKPATLNIIFSDLCAERLTKEDDPKSPIIWVCLHEPHQKPSFGRNIQIDY